MVDNGEPQYDPYIPAGGAGAAGANTTAPGNQRTAALQAVSIDRSFLRVNLRVVESERAR